MLTQHNNYQITKCRLKSSTKASAKSADVCSRFLRDCAQVKLPVPVVRGQGDGSRRGTRRTYSKNNVSVNKTPHTPSPETRP